MKIRLLLLGLSMAGHLVAGYLYLRATPDPETAPTATSVYSPDARADYLHPKKTSTVASPPLPPDIWQRLDQPELTDFVAELRRAGFPPSTVKALAAYKLEGELNALKISINYPNDTVGYWEKPDKATRAQQDAVAQFTTEADQRLRDALGHDEATSEAELTQLTQHWGDLPLEKLRAVNAIEQDYREIFTDSTRDTPVGEFPTDLYAMLEKERNADIADTLGPDAFLEYRLRNSRLASSLRRTFRSAQITEDEFRAIFHAAETAAASNGPSGISSPTGLRSGGVVNNPLRDPKTLTAIFDQLGETLPANRVADFQQLTAPNAFRENGLVQRLGLPLTTATTLVSYRNEIQTLLSATRGSPANAEQQAGIVARVQTIDNEIQTLLGAEGYSALKSRARNSYPDPEQVAAALAERASPPTGG